MADWGGTWLVRIGGVLIIVSILGILLYILVETWPLLGGAEVAEGRSFALPGDGFRGVVVNEHRDFVATMSRDGNVLILDNETGDVVVQRPIFADEAGTGDGVPPERVEHVRVPGLSRLFVGVTDAGRLFVTPVDFRVTFEGDTRVIIPRIGETEFVAVADAGERIGAFTALVDEDGALIAAAQTSTGSLVLARRAVVENDFTGEVEVIDRREESPVGGRLSSLVISEADRLIYGGTADGNLLTWSFAREDLGKPEVVSAGSSAVTAVTLLLGGRSLIVGQDDGVMSVWFRVRSGDNPPVLTRIREFREHDAPIRALSPSPRDKGFVSLDQDGIMGLHHSTAHRTLWIGEAPLPGAMEMYFTAKADSVFLSDGSDVAELTVDNPHPDLSLRSLLGKVWYESYEEPAYVWQSSAAEDDFEPKLSLMPLLIGSLKGTFYSMLLAVPLGVLGAMYASQFMHRSLKRVVKPTVEIMAALPSVVLGFLAGLWLAPRVEQMFSGLILMAFLLPAFALLSGFLYSRLSPELRSRLPMGTEAIVAMGFLLVGGWVSLRLAVPFENLAFGGAFKPWLQQALGVTYDQRNAVVVGLGMGFAVIPIIFSVAEDAFSNVPRNLLAGSLALGASRWQTVTRVVLPTASPGIFSAIMIGFGRAVGETMIVLMATGNTPIMDWSPFNGFRTLSANIAVEIPEAPHGGTLYRTLFLAALLLFLLTFVVNTAAELVRQHLRNRYANL
jgi:phosphate transport system permease protein